MVRTDFSLDASSIGRSLYRVKRYVAERHPLGEGVRARRSVADGRQRAGHGLEPVGPGRHALRGAADGILVDLALGPQPHEEDGAGLDPAERGDGQGVAELAGDPGVLGGRHEVAAEGCPHLLHAGAGYAALVEGKDQQVCRHLGGRG